MLAALPVTVAMAAELKDRVNEQQRTMHKLLQEKRILCDKAGVPLSWGLSEKEVVCASGVTLRDEEFTSRVCLGT